MRRREIAYSSSLLLHVRLAPSYAECIDGLRIDLKNACWGGLMTARAQHLGVKGAVIDGRCRDLAEHREANFPVRSLFRLEMLTSTNPAQVFARGQSTLGQATFVRASEVQVPLLIEPRSTGDGPAFPAIEVRSPLLHFVTLVSLCAQVQPHSLIIADVDGIVNIAPDQIDAVIAQANKSREADRKVMADLHRGVSVSEAFKRHR